MNDAVIDMSRVSARQPERQAVTVASDLTPGQMLAIAVQQGADLQKLEKLMDLRDRWEAGEARKAFTAALAAFKAEPVRILKTKKVDIPGGAKFAHATLADVCDGVVMVLSKHGLSHRWELKQLQNGWPEVTCILTHQAGHSERTTLAAPADDSGKKNNIQQIASTVTYLERYTLMAAVGLSAKDMDDDGRGGKQLQAEAPKGYDSWKADMGVKAEDGSAALQEAWKGSSDDFRKYVIKWDEAWWRDTKAKAQKVTQ